MGRLTNRYHILIDRIWHSITLDVRSFRGPGCDTVHSLVVAKVREWLAVSKQEAQRTDGERLNLRKLNELEVRNQYQTEIINRFAALENLSVGENINRLWENIKENIKTSATENLGLQELIWFDKECLGFLEQRKQAKMQWLQYPSQSNVNNLNNVRYEASRHFRNKSKEYLKVKIEELETNNKIKNIRGLYWSISYFKNGYQPRTVIVEDEKGDFVTDSQSILASYWMYMGLMMLDRWKYTQHNH